MHPILGCTWRGSCSWKGVFLPSKCLLESPFLEPLLRSLPPDKTNTNPLLRTLLRTFSEAVSRTLLRTLLRRRVVARPPWCAPKLAQCWFFKVRPIFKGCVFFTYNWGLFAYGGVTVSRKDQTQFPNRVNRKHKIPNPISGRGGTASRKDQTDFHRQQQDQTKFSP